MKKLRRWAAGLLLTPILLFIILAALLYLPPVQNWVADKVSAMASESTGMDISIGHVSLEWPFDLGIDDLRVIHDGDTLADVGHATIDVQLKPILSKRLVVNELSLSSAKINTNGFISDVRVKGQVGTLWLRSNGIDLEKESVEVNGARLDDANLDIALSDTAAVDTTTSETKWRICADSLSINNSALALHMPGDTLHVNAYMGRMVARQADIDLRTSTYRMACLEWADGRLAYDNDNVQPVDGLDYNHISLSGIRLDVDSICYGQKGVSLFISQTAFKEKSGIQLTEVRGGVRLDTAFTYVELPHLTLRTTDSAIETEAHVDFSVADEQKPGKMKVRLNAQLGKQDLMHFMGNLPQQSIQRYPNSPLCIRGSVNGNVKRVEFTALDIQLQKALHVRADGFAADMTDLKRMRAQIAMKAETQNLDFVTPMIPVAGVRLPAMTLEGELKADRGNYSIKAAIQEGKGRVKADVALPNLNDVATYSADVKVSNLNLYHFLPQDSLYNLTADLTADLTMKKGRATGVILAKNRLLDGSIGIDALLSSKKIEAEIKPDLKNVDLYGLHLTGEPLSFGMAGNVAVKSDLKLSHEVKGRLNNLSVTDDERTFHPKDIGLLIRTNRDTTLARVQSGDFIVKMDGSGSYERLMKQGSVLADSVMAQFKDKVIDQVAIKRLLPTLKLHVESGRNNPVADILRSNEIDFRDFLLELNTSAETGVNGQIHLYALNYDSIRIDTTRLTLTQKGNRMTYSGQVRNNRKNPQFVFNTLFDGHVHEHGALMGIRYYDKDNRMGIRLGSKASMVDEGICITLMPERPTIGYKEFNLNSDNYIILGRNNRVKANVDLIADDRTGMKIYSTDQEETTNGQNYMQNLTVSLNRINLDELSSVIPYLPRLSGVLNGDFHIVQDQDEHFSVVSDMAVQNMAYEGSKIGNISTELVYMQREDEGHAVEARLMLDDEEFGLLQGNLIPGKKADKEDNIDARFTMTRLPLSLVNGFVPDQLIGLDGYGEGELAIKGTTAKPIVDGEVYLDSAYLVSRPYGVRMRFDNDPVRIVGSHLLLENFGLYAYNDEPLNMQADIDFSNLDRVMMDMRMRARNLQLINARQEPQSIVFGKAFVNFFARLNGPLDALKMRGRLDVLGSTDMTYMLLDSPLSTDNRLEELVKFTDFTDSVQTVSTHRPTPSGLEMTMTLSVSQGAHIVCNLNTEQTNYIDLMGGGDLRMQYTGTDGLSLTGRYTLASGEMKYSLPVIPLKTFTIQDGSYVEFTGDPMNPRLNITATERTKASVSDGNEQSRSVVFDCGVVITKTLSDMGLQFVISAPEDNNINSELQSMSAEERGKLAVTMLTTGMYLADGNTNGFSMNSVLSAYLQSEINNIAGSALKTLDLSVGMDNTTDASGQSHTDYSFKFSKRLFNNRLKIQFGGKVSSGASEIPGQKQSFFDNVTMEYRLDQNATKNVKLFYQQNIYDWLDGYTGLYGIGYVWRKKMDSLWDVFKRQQNTLLTTERNVRATQRDSLSTDTLKTQQP